MTTPELRVGVSSVEASAIAQIDGDKTRGTLPWPRMTTAQRTAITGTNGLTVYDTDLQALFIWESGAWAVVSSSSGGVANGFTTTVTAAGTTTLTNASTPVQEFTGATTQDCVLPNATTLIVGWTFVIRNASTGAVTVKTNGGATLVTLAANQQVTLYCKTIGTAAGTWSQEVVTGTGARVLAVSPILTTPNIGAATGTSLTIASDTDASTILGRTRIDSRVTDSMMLSHFDQTGNGSYAIVQTAAGQTSINAAAGQTTNLRINGVALVGLSATVFNMLVPQTTTVTDAATNTIVPVVTLTKESSGTPANGMGGSLPFNLESSTTAGQNAARLRWYWNDATHASRKAYAVLSAYDTAERDVIGWGASGSAALLGFYPTKAAAPVAQPTALTTQLTAITHTAPGTPDYAVQDLTQTTPFGFVTKDEGNTVLSVIANLQTRVGELETKLQSLGLIA